MPIVPHFTPSHINIGAKAPVPPLPFGDVFDLPRMRNLTGKAILEWIDVKDPESGVVEDVGCWVSSHEYLFTALSANNMRHRTFGKV